MKQAYVETSFRSATLGLITQASAIIEEYQADGYSLTLRQLYYQFVARGLIENNQHTYKRLGKIISNARLAGLIDWDAIEDRTRNMESNSHWESPGDILVSAADSYRRDLWADQEHAVEVWIEKEALIGVIESVCTDLDIPYFACRGYVSQSEQWRAGKRAMTRFRDNGQKTVIIHLGDHDPSGIDMTRDVRQRLEMFAGFPQAVMVERIALNWEQVQEFRPPPNPAKSADTRTPDYIKRYGPESWELDALEPRLIDRLIRQHVQPYCDEYLMSEAKAQQEQERNRLYELAQRHG